MELLVVFSDIGLLSIPLLEVGLVALLNHTDELLPAARCCFKMIITLFSYELVSF